MFQLPRCSLCYCCKVGGLWAFACFFQSRQTRKASTVAGQLLGRFVDNRCQSSDNSSCVLFLWRHTSLERLRTLCQCLITSTYSIKNDSKLFFLSRFVLTAFRTSTHWSLTLTFQWTSVLGFRALFTLCSRQELMQQSVSASAQGGDAFLSLCIGHSNLLKSPMASMDTIFYSYTVEYADCLLFLSTWKTHLPAVA